MAGRLTKIRALHKALRRFLMKPIRIVMLCALLVLAAPSLALPPHPAASAD
jgi:hypothetical protein